MATSRSLLNQLSCNCLKHILLKRRCFIICTASFVVTGIFLFKVITILFDNTITRPLSINQSNTITNAVLEPLTDRTYTRFVVDTPSCRIPDMDPHDPVLRGVIGPPSFLKCKKFTPYTYDVDNIIYVNWTAINETKFKDEFSHCNCIPVIRPINEKTTHNSVDYLEAGPNFNHSVEIDDVAHEYVYVRCFNKKEEVIFQNYHFIMMIKNDVEKRCEENSKKRREKNPDVKEQMNVLIVILDSVSRLNFMRFMNQTRHFLLDNLDAIDMTGYNKVGYGTFHNMIPATTGKFDEELPWSFEFPNIFDKYDFIWDKYVENGYRTHYAEDYPFGALFDYKKPGFKKNPADYYGRHMFLSMYKKSGLVYNEENCILHKQQTDWVLDPAYKFIKTFKSMPYFCFLLITRLTHDWLERTAAADELYLNFFKKAYNDKILNNTMLIVTADHGMRFGPIRSKFIGLMEERLPLLYYSFPKWFTKKYPQHIHNLKINAHRLTTPFDLYETLYDFVTFDGKIKPYDSRKRAQSMFTEIDRHRSCADAGVPAHWCTCYGFQNVGIHEKIVNKSAQFLIDTINNKLRDVQHLCEYLVIKKITFAYKLNLLEKNRNKDVVSHRIALVAQPGLGLFEGTISYHKHKKEYTLSSEVSRISQYGGEKRCNVQYSLERLCYCKANRNKGRA